MRNFRNYLIMDNQSSYNFNMYISGGGTYSSPEKTYEEVEIPGKNGVIIFEEGDGGQTYKNIIVSYESFIYPEFDKNFSKLKSFLLSRNGYFRLEDTYHPDEYRMGTYLNTIEPDMHQTLETGLFTLEFNCKPQRFLKYGEEIIETSSNLSIRNRTDMIAKPLIRIYGNGTVTITNDYGSRAIRVNSSPQGYTDVDCDLMDAYAGTVNCNNNITLVNSKFPILYPGDNNITITSGLRLQITPRWWML